MTLNEKMLDAQVALQRRLVAASERQSLSRETRSTALGGGMLLGALAEPLAALAAPGASGSATSCGGDAAKSLAGLIDRAGGALIYLGGAVALFMITLGGFRIIAGHKESAVKDGMKNVKNALIGLAILALGVFIREVVVKGASAIGGEQTSGPVGCLPTSSA